MSRRFRLIYFPALVCMALFQAVTGMAQGLQARAYTDTVSIRIGEQFDLHVELTAPAKNTIRFPAFADSLDAFEIVGKSKIDTVDNQNNTLTYKQVLQLTRFDSGFYVIPPIVFHRTSPVTDSVATEALLLTVNTVPVDTTAAIRDIKPVVDLPITFREILPYLLLVLALAALGYWLFRFLKSRKKVPEVILPKAAVIPPYETALASLKQLAEEKLWQQGLYKHYHTRLTDIVRTYIEHSFGILAMEQTSDEILQDLRRKPIREEAREKLEPVLRLADLVKFAKVQPVSTENEGSLVSVRDFVMLTRPVIEEDLKPKEATA